MGMDNGAIMKITGSVGGGDKKKVRNAIKSIQERTLSQRCCYS